MIGWVWLQTHRAPLSTKTCSLWTAWKLRSTTPEHSTCSTGSMQGYIHKAYRRRDGVVWVPFDGDLWHVQSICVFYQSVDQDQRPFDAAWRPFIRQLWAKEIEDFTFAWAIAIRCECCFGLVYGGAALFYVTKSTNTGACKWRFFLHCCISWADGAEWDVLETSGA